jgi:hypothetical protein
MRRASSEADRKMISSAFHGTFSFGCVPARTAAAIRIEIITAIPFEEIPATNDLLDIERVDTFLKKSDMDGY